MAAEFERFQTQAPGETGKDNCFRHTALDKSKNEIRLLHVRVDGESRQYDIRHYELKTAPTYRALSYEWGSQNSMQQITIGGKVFEIRSNLDKFLDQFCRVSRDEYLWIDQVTIDQVNLQERNHQVSMMADIYSSAQQVIIWIPVEYWSVFPGRGQCQIACRCPDYCLSMTELWVSKYWSRVWIMEEVVLARSIEIFYGDCILQWPEVVVLAQIYDTKYEFEYASFAWLLKHATTMNAPGAERLDLWDVLSSCGEANCSDRRDIVYAVQALIKPSQRVAIDYTKTKQEVFFDAATASFAGFCEFVDQDKTWQPEHWNPLSYLLGSLAYRIFEGSPQFLGIDWEDIQELVSLRCSGERKRAFESLVQERLEYST